MGQVWQGVVSNRLEAQSGAEWCRRGRDRWGNGQASWAGAWRGKERYGKLWGGKVWVLLRTDVRWGWLGFGSARNATAGYGSARRGTVW